MNETNEKVIRVGSRKSELALIQTKHVIRELQNMFPEKKFEIHTMSTIGDRILNISLPKIGEKSLFTRDLEDALRHGRVDFIVHSLKDLPTALPTGLTIGAVLEREDSRDALVLNEKYKGYSLQNLPIGSIIGTSSLRRTAQIRRKYPHLELCDIRGNLNTRLAKLDAENSKFAGIILAQAGLVRMGWLNRISQILEPEELLYCVGQGALAVECRANDKDTLTMIQNLMCISTTSKILAERSFLKTLGGGCSAPVAVCSELNNTMLSLSGAVWSLNGKIEVSGKLKCSLEIAKRRKTEEYSTTEDEDDEHLSPSKRSRIDQKGDDNENSIKRDSPKIVNDDPVLQKIGDGVMPDLQYLINVHGEAFKKCPFYALHKKDKENGTTSSKKDECPLKIPIGQEFMGLCPYLDTEKKVELSEKGICPITGKRMTAIENVEFERKDQTTSENTTVKRTAVSPIDVSNDNNNEKEAQCPYSKKITSVNNSKTANTSEIFNEDGKVNSAATTSKSLEQTKSLPLDTNLKLVEDDVGHKSCPFLQKVIQIDHSDEDKTNEIIERSLSPEVVQNECKDIFCGIFRHKCFDKNIYIKCDELGRQLAHNLINKGALKIMKLAQDEIHQNIHK